jgi:hypothetical protein
VPVHAKVGDAVKFIENVVVPLIQRNELLLSYLRCDARPHRELNLDQNGRPVLKVSIRLRSWRRRPWLGDFVFLDGNLDWLLGARFHGRSSKENLYCRVLWD